MSKLKEQLTKKEKRSKTKKYGMCYQRGKLKNLAKKKKTFPQLAAETIHQE